jgi:hypothetical protein
LVVLACVAAGWLALGAAGNDRPAVRAAARAAATEKVAESSLPPLPTKSRARAVQPVAGEATPSDEVAADPGLTQDDSKPTAPASAAIKGEHPASGGSNAVDHAIALGNGVALPPLEAPDAVKQIIEAGNGIARTPYIWGGGHARLIDRGYDCSGSLSFAFIHAGLLDKPIANGWRLMGEAGPGKWLTVYSSTGHVWMELAGLRYDTSALHIAGSRWTDQPRSTAGFRLRHLPGL